jgi:indolepyruvate ferredoxin oxidoreductase alpha subunit
MKTELLMGNQAIALGAIHAGVNVVTGYPGTPSSEIVETIAKRNNGSINVEWSVNEKAALEVGAGAAYAGARTLVTMKQVGLNVASDPLMSLAYVGVKGGMVIVSADDPGPISSQTEQDTRSFAAFAKIPVFDPASPEEAYTMIQDAFEFSERYQTPVLFRPTTRVCHACSSITYEETYTMNDPEGFIKDTKKWVIFPKLSYLNHIKIEKRNQELCSILSDYQENKIIANGKQGIATAGISYLYTREALSANDDVKIMKIATAFPFPEKLALEFLKGLEEVMVLEELDPVIERELVYLCGKYNLNVKIHGKLDGKVANAGENTAESVGKVLNKYLGRKSEETVMETIEETKTIDITEIIEELPVRPPVLCAGCPHRASFYAVKQAVKGRKAVFSGDIGCYTLGNAMPLDMVDTCLCMGAGVTIAQGLEKVEPDTLHFAFIGDSTFFASGITGVVNAVYNQNDMILVVLDNSTTAMTGHQPHPGTGKTVMGDITEKISIEKILAAIGVKKIVTANPLDFKESVQAVKAVSDIEGVRAIIYKSPCVAVTKPNVSYIINDQCINCKKCINEIGCPAIVLKEGKPFIEAKLCFGCSLCEQICPVTAIEKEASINE